MTATFTATGPRTGGKALGKRGNGEGSIYRRKDGRWAGQHTIQTATGPKRLGAAATLGFLATRFLKSSSQEAGSAGDGTDTTPISTSGAATTTAPLRAQEPSTAHPPGPLEGEFPTTAERSPAAGQPPSDRERVEPPRGY